MKQTTPTTDCPSPPTPSLGSLVWHLAGLISKKLPPGDVAALRRLRPEDPGCPPFWKLMATEINANAFGDAGRADDEEDRRWAAVLSALATLDGLVQTSPDFGTALARADYSELRFERLLRAGDAQLLDELLNAVRFLAAKAEPLNPVDIARLALTRDPEKGESLRRKLARQYYRIVSTHPKKES